MPIAFVVMAVLFAVLSTRPASRPTESAGALTSLAPTADAIGTESLPHAHSTVEEEETDGHVHEIAATTSPVTHQHSPGPTSPTDAVAGDGHTHDTTTPEPTEPTGPIVSIDDPRLSPTQQNAARSLLVTTRSTIASLPDTAALTAAGYVSVGDNSSGLQHWVKDAHTKDGRELDPGRIESFMVKTATGRVVGAMYMLEPGKTMANVPDIAGDLTIWHVHEPICFSAVQIWRFVSFARNGNCAAGSAVRTVPPMMHVWADDPPCGPFVGTEGHGSSTCSAHPH